MAWSFYFTGVTGDAITALNAVTASDGPGHADQLNRAKTLITQEINALSPGSVVCACSGSFKGSGPFLTSSVVVSVQQAPLVNGMIAVPPSPQNV